MNIYRGVRETFLKTPFFDASNASHATSSCDANVFKKFSRPADVAGRLFDVDKFPVKKIEDDYVRINVRAHLLTSKLIGQAPITLTLYHNNLRRWSTRYLKFTLSPTLE